MSKIIRISISVLLLTWLAWQMDWVQVGRAFTQLRLELWLAAVAVLIAIQVVSAVRWRIISRAVGFSRPLHQMIGFYFIGMYFNLLLPTSVGGDVARVWYLDGGSKRRMRALVSVLVERLSGLTVLLILACLGVLLSPLPLPMGVRLGVWACAAGGGTVMLLLPLLIRYREHLPLIVRQKLAAFGALPPLRALPVPFALSVVVQTGNIAIVWLVGLALGAAIPDSYYWVLVPLVSLLTLLPISVNGMGVREGAMALLLAPFGVARETAITLALLWFAVFATVSLMGGLVYMFGRFPRPALPETKNEESNDDGSVDHHSNQGRTGQPKTATSPAPSSTRAVASHL